MDLVHAKESSPKEPARSLLRLVLLSLGAVVVALNSLDALALVLLVAVFLVLLVALPAIEAARFLIAGAPWWAYLVAAAWLALLGRFIFHLLRQDVRWSDALFYGGTLFASLLFMALELTAT